MSVGMDGLRSIVDIGVAASFTAVIIASVNAAARSLLNAGSAAGFTSPPPG